MDDTYRRDLAILDAVMAELEKPEPSKEANEKMLACLKHMQLGTNVLLMRYQRDAAAAATASLPPTATSVSHVTIVRQLAKHEERLLVDPATGQLVPIDTRLAPLIEALWQLGISTSFSCEGLGEDECGPTDWAQPAYIRFSSVAYLQMFLTLIERYGLSEFIHASWQEYDGTLARVKANLDNLFNVYVQLDPPERDTVVDKTKHFPHMSGTAEFAKGSIQRLTECIVAEVARKAAAEAVASDK